MFQKKQMFTLNEFQTEVVLKCILISERWGHLQNIKKKMIASTIAKFSISSKENVLILTGTSNLHNYFPANQLILII